MFQPRQHDRLTRLLDLARQKHLVQDSVDLVEIEDEIQFAHVAEELVQHLDEEVDRFQVGEFVVGRVDAHAEEEAGVASVHDLGAALELDEI